MCQLKDGVLSSYVYIHNALRKLILGGNCLQFVNALDFVRNNFSAKYYL